MFLKKIILRAKLEWQYYTKRPWSLEEVGKFWDTVEEYDKINDKLYTYKERFHVSKKKFFENVTEFYPKKILDIQTRSGNGSLFWNDIYPNAHFTCVDFSEGLLNKAKNKIGKINYKEFILLKNLDEMQLKNNEYDLILCYETLEHIYEYEKFIKFLTKLMNKNSYLILTTPNVVWEIVHWITAIVGYNHSEGPHRFISKKKIDKVLDKNELITISYTSSIFFPFNNKISICLDKIVTKILPNFIKEKIFLRHIYILKKIS